MCVCVCARARVTIQKEDNENTPSVAAQEILEAGGVEEGHVSEREGNFLATGQTRQYSSIVGVIKKKSSQN